MVSNPVPLYNALIYNSSFVFLKQPEEKNKNQNPQTNKLTETAEGAVKFRNPMVIAR